MLRLIGLFLFIYFSIPSLTSCSSEVKKATRDTLTVAEVDSLIRITNHPPVTYKGIIANYGSRELPFTVDSGKVFSYELISKSENLKIMAWQEKTNSVLNPADSTRKKVWSMEKVSDSSIFAQEVSKPTKFKLKLYLSADGIKNSEIAKYELKIKL